jgi:glycosyltransferase involved in cell wall biosynthesis
MYFLSIIIPLYNEETLITEVIKQVMAVKFPASVSQYEIIVVDDCSTDRSLEVITAIAEQNQQIKVLKHEKNRGKGAAVRTGIQSANGNVFLIQDSDLELRPADIPGMVNCMEELNVEFINGSRYLAGVYRPLASYKRYLGNRIFTSLTAIIINVKITDMACGYKLIHKNLFEKIKLTEDR